MARGHYASQIEDSDGLATDDRTGINDPRDNLAGLYTMLPRDGATEIRCHASVQQSRLTGCRPG